MSLPEIVTRADWRAAREALLAKEKAATRARDALNAERRGLPMVEVDKEYVFEGGDGKATLLDLFEGREQLVVYHFMFAPEWDAGCRSCSAFLDQIAHLAHLRARGTSFAAVSRAPYPRIGGADLQDHEPGRRGRGQPGRDAGQRREDQPGRAEHLDHADGADGGHRRAVHPGHHRPERVPAAHRLHRAPVEVEGGEESGDDPVRDVHDRVPRGPAEPVAGSVA